MYTLKTLVVHKPTQLYFDVCFVVIVCCVSMCGLFKMLTVCVEHLCPSIAQLVERWTVVVMVIHRSLVRIRLEGLFFLFLSASLPELT